MNRMIVLMIFTLDRLNLYTRYYTVIIIGYGKYYYCPQISILRVFQGINVNSDWGATNIPGDCLLKLPSYRTRHAAIAIEIDPVDAAGSKTKESICMYVV
jgi:hypothetical protein